MHWLGSLDANQEAYLNYLPVCLGEFAHSGSELAEFLARSKQTHHNPLPVAKLNRQYLRFARLAAKDVVAGKLEMLVRLGLNLDQIQLLSKLPNEAMNRLAFGWDDGAIIRFDSRAFTRGAALNGPAAQIHAIGFITTRRAT